MSEKLLGMQRVFGGNFEIIYDPVSPSHESEAIFSGLDLDSCQ